MNLSDILSNLRKHPDYDGQLVHIENIPSKTGNYAHAQLGLHTILEKALANLGLTPMYVHQAQAIAALFEGENVMVATPAASGKSLVYNAIVLDRMLNEGNSTALYLFPTKALARDQRRVLNEILSCDDNLNKIAVATFDGDTGLSERASIRRSAQIIFTNPDMLHLGILPNHKSWQRFFSKLRYVVLDEAHIYRGVFGSQVANVVRRLRRICNLYGCSPQFVLSSATIANPKQHSESLIGLKCTVVKDDNSPAGEKMFAFWNPPIIDPSSIGRRSPNTEATHLFTHLVSSGIRTLAFARTRRVAELIYMYSKEQIERTVPSLIGRISSYRAGYLAEDRRRIEKGLSDRTLLGVSATNALELGIDIGDLDATILNGYPGSISSAWQQAGRSGRRGDSSLTLLIGHANPLDQYFMRNPKDFFERPHEHALISVSNPYILRPHLLCAAYERPLSRSDFTIFGEGTDGHVRSLLEQGLLKYKKGRWYISPEVAYPADEVNIRSASIHSYIIVVKGTGMVLETVEENTAFSHIHPGAVYLHQGESYLITDLDIEARTASAVLSNIDYYTQTIEKTDLKIVEVQQQSKIGGVDVYRGWVRVSSTVIGYRRKARITEEVLSEEVLDLPCQSFNTSALWFNIPDSAINKIQNSRIDLAGGLHAAEHAAIGLLPLFALCDRADIGGLSTLLHSDTGQAQVFIYDGYPGGIGITEKGFELIYELWEATLATIEQCPCQAGCPSCIQSPKCGNNNEPLDKTAAKYILEDLIEFGRVVAS